MDNVVHVDPGGTGSGDMEVLEVVPLFQDSGINKRKSLMSPNTSSKVAKDDAGPEEASALPQEVQCSRAADDGQPGVRDPPGVREKLGAVRPPRS